MINRTVKSAGLMLLIALAIAARPAATSAASSVPAPLLDNTLASAPGKETALLAGGCYWGVQSVYEHVKGVKVAVAGYAGGHDYAEAVRVVFDPSVISYGQVLRLFFAVAHDPTELNRQGPDVGPQYRSEIYYQNDTQRRIAEAYIAQLGKAAVFANPIVTVVSATGSFKVADASQQSYAAMHPGDPYIVTNDVPKVEHLRSEFPELYRQK